MAKRRGNREGSIYQRSNGRWSAQVTIDGKRLSQSFASQKECRAWVRATVDQIDDGLSFTGARLTLGEYLQTWLQSSKGSVRPKTWHQYEGIIRNHLAPHLGKTRLSELQPYMIQQTYAALREAGHSQRNVQLVHSVLHRSLVIAQRQGLIGRNPVDAIEPPRVSHKEMRILDDNQARQLIITAQGSRDEAIYHLALTTGLRQGELLGLNWRDIDWSANTLQVKRQLQRIPQEGLCFGEPKTRAGRRMIQLGEATMRLLAAHRQRQDQEKMNSDWPENDLVFPSTIGTPMEPRNLYRRYKTLLKKAGLPDIRFHDLRHTAATLMLLNGIPLLVVSRRLGHSKPSVTLDIYGHAMPGMQDEAAALMDEMMTPITAQLQPNCSSPENASTEKPDLTAYVAVIEHETATYSVPQEGLEPPTN
jgi:integrase